MTTFEDETLAELVRKLKFYMIKRIQNFTGKTQK